MINTEVNEALVQLVSEIYGTASLKMLNKVKTKAEPLGGDNWASAKNADIQEIRNELNSIMSSATTLAKTKVSDGIIKSYLLGKRSADIDAGVAKSVLSGVIPTHLEKLILDTNSLLTNAHFQVLRNAEDSYRNIIADSTTGLLVGTDTRLQATQDALKRFAANGITGFVDKAGRNWQLDVYAEMATRTVSARAALQGHIDRQLELGDDLVQVSYVGATCPICMPWQGKVLSITGSDKAYPSLSSAQSAGLFHPNCKHTLLAYYPEIDDAPSPTRRSEKEDAELYKATQVQRKNERSIRYWKRQEAVSITPDAKSESAAKVAYYQSQQRNLIKQYEGKLTRRYARESLGARSGAASTATKFYDLDLKRKPVTSFEPDTIPDPVKAKLEPMIDELLEVTPKSTVIDRDEIAARVKEQVIGSVGSKVKLKNKLKGIVNKTYIDDIQNVFDTKCDPKLKALFDDNITPLTVKEAGMDNSHYKYSTIHVKMDKDISGEREKFNIFFHESGHYLDDRLGSSRYVVSARSSFTNALEKDIKKMRKDNNLNSITSFIWDNPNSKNGLHDMLSGALEGDVGTKWSHSEKYWTLQSNVDPLYRMKTVSSEGFAHLVAAKSIGNEVGYEAIKKYFPNYVEAFEKEIDKAYTKSINKRVNKMVEKELATAYKNPVVVSIPDPIPIPIPVVVQEVAPIIADIKDIPTLKNHESTLSKFIKKVDRDGGLFSYNKEAVEKLPDLVNEVVKGAEPRIRVPSSVIEDILKEGKFKTQFETKTSGGAFDLAGRKKVSKKMFGTVDALPEQYEIYGYLQNSLKGDLSDYRVSRYGDVVINLKDEIKDRMTYSIGDSLWDGEQGYLVPSRVTKPSPSWPVSMPGYADKLYSAVGKDWAGKIPDIDSVLDIFNQSYMEAQYHGGVGIKDISSIVFKEDFDISDELTEIMRSNNIKWAKYSGDKRNIVIKWIE